MAKIVRNKPATPPTADAAEAIAAFGAAADARPDGSTPSPTTSATSMPSRKKDKPKDPPKSSLIRWEGGNEDLRDAIIEYSARERYPIHTVMLEAIRRGFEEMNS